MPAPPGKSLELRDPMPNWGTLQKELGRLVAISLGVGSKRPCVSEGALAFDHQHLVTNGLEERAPTRVPSPDSSACRSEFCMEGPTKRYKTGSGH